MQNAAVTVAYGHLFVASHLGFLKTSASSRPSRTAWPRARLSDCGRPDEDTWRRRDRASACFSRTDEEYRPTYELIRTGQMPQSETVLGQVLNALLGEGKEGVLRKQKIDGGKLPEFDAVSHYFGPAGTFCPSEPNGWFLVGFTLDKARVAGEVARKPRTRKKRPRRRPCRPRK